MSRKERKKAMAREEILDAAVTVLLREGLANFRLIDVAKELGLTKAALYYYFKGREPLLMAVMARHGRQEALAINAAVTAATTAADAVEALLRTSMGFHISHREMFKLLYRGLDKTVSPSALDETTVALFRPTNELIYGAASEKIAADQVQGLVAPEVHPRRHAFVAHMAVMGVVAMKLMVESFGDPLIHKDDAMLDDLVRTFTHELRGPERAEKGA